MPQSPKRVAIWAAVSSRPQAADDKDSLPSQLRDGRSWAATIEADVVATYQIPGHSRSYIFLANAAEDMDAYRQLLDDCQEQAWDILWCRGRDRLGRTDALIAQVEAVVTQIGQAQIYSAALGLPLNASSTAEIYTSAIERAQAQEEVARLKRRHERGMKNRIHNRKLPCGNLPYGYRAVRDDSGNVIGCEFDPHEIEAVKLITERYLAGYGYFHIAHLLDDSPYRPRRSDQWHPTVIGAILQNPMYAGYVHRRDARVKSPHVPALWDEATYRQIQQEIESRYPGRRPPSTPLTGSLQCADCGHAMVAKMNHGNRIYYCNGHRITGNCHHNSIRYTTLKAALLDYLALLDDPETIRRAISGSQPDTTRLATDLQATQARIEEITEQRTRLALDRAADTMPIGVYRAADERLADQLETAQAHAADLQATLAATPDIEAQIAAIQELADLTEKRPEWLDTIPVLEAQAIIKRAGVLILCRNNHVEEIRIGEI